MLCYNCINLLCLVSSECRVFKMFVKARNCQLFCLYRISVFIYLMIFFLINILSLVKIMMFILMYFQILQFALSFDLQFYNMQKFKKQFYKDKFIDYFLYDFCNF